MRLPHLCTSNIGPWNSFLKFWLVSKRFWNIELTFNDFKRNTHFKEAQKTIQTFCIEQQFIACNIKYRKALQITDPITLCRAASESHATCWRMAHAQRVIRHWEAGMLCLANGKFMPKSAFGSLNKVLYIFAALLLFLKIRFTCICCCFFFFFLVFLL